MGLFGRKAKGRHALGAAVTSIPSGPPAVAAPVYDAPVAPAAAVFEVPVAPAAAVFEVPVSQPAPATTAEAVSQLLVTGEWAATPEAPADPAPGFVLPLAPASVPEQHLPPMNLPPLPLPLPLPMPAPSPVAPLLPAVAPVPPPSQVAPLPSVAPVVPLPLAAAAAPVSPVFDAVPAYAPVLSVAPPAAPPRSSLEAALAELLPSQQDAAAGAPEPTAPSRVQLGFRDGTSAPLDPRSSQFAELEALAQSLTQRD